ncbi:ribosomal protein bL36 [Amycolatopsis thermophila]|uniref:Large ribosomal subunit protein bL36 n=1 Tax=Amycolatopsis thermophila TaxID=206084 RepID=A0ABU0ERE9_9PSEU|nr:ribosomal protein bL36 [Amycolatopsis thermophila]MDQ0377865.1 large subunit ribosomal protein L36 [Amycolatopsis thermophila]
MKSRSSLRSLKRQPGSIVVRRRGRAFVINKRSPHLNTRQS